LPVPATPLEALLAAYQQYLEGERGLSAGTVTHYLRYARAFLAGFPGPLTDTLAGLSAGQVTSYVLEQARRRRDRAPDMVMLPALRSLLRYLHAAGIFRCRWPRRSRRAGTGGRACRAPPQQIICTRSWPAATVTAPVAVVTMPSCWR